MNRLRAFWLPAIHPLTSPCTLSTAKQHALGAGAWCYSALAVGVAEFTIPGKWPLVGLLFLGLLVAMTIELWSGYATLAPDERKVFQWHREIVGKILLLTLVAVSIILDGVIYAAVAAFAFENLPVLRSGWPFVTCSSLLWLLIAQCAGVIEHVRVAEGAAVIPPPMEFVLRQVEIALRKMKRIDHARWQQAHPGEAPPGRWQDGLTPDQLARILAIMDENADPPTAAPERLLLQGGPHPSREDDR
jgi:hypothetical protein